MNNSNNLQSPGSLFTSPMPKNKCIFNYQEVPISSLDQSYISNYQNGEGANQNNMSISNNTNPQNFNNIIKDIQNDNQSQSSFDMTQLQKAIPNDSKTNNQGSLNGFQSMNSSNFRNTAKFDLLKNGQQDDDNNSKYSMSLEGSQYVQSSYSKTYKTNAKLYINQNFNDCSSIGINEEDQKRKQMGQSGQGGSQISFDIPNGGGQYQKDILVDASHFKQSGQPLKSLNLLPKDARRGSLLTTISPINLEAQRRSSYRFDKHNGVTNIDKQLLQPIEESMSPSHKFGGQSNPDSFSNLMVNQVTFEDNQDRNDFSYKDQMYDNINCNDAQDEIQNDYQIDEQQQNNNQEQIKSVKFQQLQMQIPQQQQGEQNGNYQNNHELQTIYSESHDKHKFYKPPQIIKNKERSNTNFAKKSRTQGPEQLGDELQQFQQEQPNSAGYDMNEDMPENYTQNRRKTYSYNDKNSQLNQDFTDDSNDSSQEDNVKNYNKNNLYNEGLRKIKQNVNQYKNMLLNNNNTNNNIIDNEYNLNDDDDNNNMNNINGLDSNTLPQIDFPTTNNRNNNYNQINNQQYEINNQNDQNIKFSQSVSPKKKKSIGSPTTKINKRNVRKNTGKSNKGSNDDQLDKQTIQLIKNEEILSASNLSQMPSQQTSNYKPTQTNVSSKRQSRRIKKETIDTSHAPINVINLLTRYLRKIYDQKDNDGQYIIPCKSPQICTQQIDNFVGTQVYRTVEEIRASNLCQRCKEVSYIHEIKKTKKKNIANLGEFWQGSVRIQVLSEDFLINNCPYRFESKAYVDKNRKALVYCLKEFIAGNRNPKEFNRLQ